MTTLNILHPSRYHGFGARPPYFEGWYYKLVDKDQNHKYAIIPGVYLSEQQETRHSFIQVFKSEDDEVHYHRYPYDAFKADKDQFRIQIGPNSFTSKEVILAIKDDLGEVKGRLKFENLTPWPVKIFSPGAMGWFAWVPFMECYHGVVSMDHRIQGKLNVNGELLDFSDGTGYTEKDWGKQFPSAWIWGQSNHFDRPGVSLMMSVAVIPWLGSSFGGFIIGLLFEGKIHRFATYNSSKVEKISLDDKEVNLVVRNRDYRLTIRASRTEGGLLQAPTKITMGRRIMETLNAKISIKLKKLAGEVIYEGTGGNAGLETVGDMDQLIDMIE